MSIVSENSSLHSLHATQHIDDLALPSLIEQTIDKQITDPLFEDFLQFIQGDDNSCPGKAPNTFEETLNRITSINSHSSNPCTIDHTYAKNIAQKLEEKSIELEK